MKKILLSLILLVTALSAYADKAIYYPFYMINVEVYQNDVLTKTETIYHQNTYKLPMFQEGCTIEIATPEDIVPFIKESISNRRAANMAMASSVINSVASVATSVRAFGASTPISTSLYLTQSSLFLTEAYLDYGIMRRFKYYADESLVLPVSFVVKNTSDKILRGNIIVRPDEALNIKNSFYCDDWRIKDNDNNVYCISVAAYIVRDKGYISRQMGVAFSQPTKEEKEEGHKHEYLRIDLNTYETRWVHEGDKELQILKMKYGDDNGYNEHIEPIEFDESDY